ncbi:unnamed protein product, partial [Clonostachys rhizophaga]
MGFNIVLARHRWLDDLDHSVMAEVGGLLKGMQSLGQQIISTQRLYFDGSPSTIEKSTARLHLMYYHVSTNPPRAITSLCIPACFFPDLMRMQAHL